MAPLSSPAASATAAGAYASLPIPTTFERHLMNRMGTGYTPTQHRLMRWSGGPGPWFERQLVASQVQQSPKVAQVDSWFPGRRESMAQRARRQAAGQKSAYAYALELGNWSLLRRIYSRRAVHENMVDLWSNHFHVPAHTDRAWIGRHQFDIAIRANALGRFDQLLEAVTLQSSMLIFLDNDRSVRNAPNENHGRELLELHTVGGGYSEDMVRDSAAILSGWRVREGTTWEAFYDPARHTMGRVDVLGFSAANAVPDGREVTRRYLRYLAHHPLTARTVARKLAIRFVADVPPATLVDRLARVYLSSGTDLKATLRALVRSPEFAASVGGKVRTPYDDLVATVRVLGIDVQQPTTGESFAHVLGLGHGAQQLFMWPRPDGPPQTNAPWCSASRMLASYQMHWSMSGHFWPRRGAIYRPHGSWLPTPWIRFDNLVDHLCRTLTGRASTPLVLRAASEACGLTPATALHRDHPFVVWRLPRLLTTVLDSPAHLTR